MATSLPRFQQLAPLVDDRGLPTSAFHVWWDTFAKQIETILDDQQSQLDDITQLQADMQDRIDEITQLQSDMADRIDEITQLQADMLDRIAEIEAAQLTADTAKRDDAISASATSPSTILTATDAGTDATISILAHDRIYGDGLVRAIDAGSITGLSYSTLYAVYYDDTARTAGSKTFIATTTLKDAQYNKAAGRHFCGQVTTPAMGGGSSSGGPGIPGGGGPYP